jgi:ribose transport system substrate-binding protein
MGRSKRSAPKRFLRASTTFVVLAALAVIGAVAATAAITNHASKTGIPISKLPASVRASYDGYQHTVKGLLPNPYANWTPKAPPWKFCLNESLLQNGWRQGNLKELQKLNDQYRVAHLAKGSLKVTNSNGNPALQISQFNSLVSAGCDVIFTLPASPTALCPAIATANAKGVLVITDDTAVDCPKTINVTFNGYLNMKLGAASVFKALKNSGSVIVITGYKGSVGEAIEAAAVADAHAKYPGVDILGEVEGQWTPSVAQSKTAEFLATHPQKIDGILDEGEMGVAAEQALEGAGRPLAKVNFASGSCADYAFWKEHPELVTLAASQAPAASAYEAFLVAAKMLNGQKPVVNTLMYQIPENAGAKIGTFYKPYMTLKSNCYANSPDIKAVPDSYFAPLFKGGKPIKPIKG